MSVIDQAAVRTGDAAVVAGITAAALLKHIDRGQIQLGNRDKDSLGSGDARLLTVRRVFQAALFMRLCGLGVRPNVVAAMAAMAAGEPGTPEPGGWLVRLPGRCAEILETPPPSGAEGLAVDLSKLLAEVRDKLAIRVPALRATGIV